MKVLKITFFVIFISVISSLRICAYSLDLPEGQVDVAPMIDSIPKDTLEMLPDKALESRSSLEIAYGADGNFIIKFILNTIKTLLPKTTETMCSLLCFIVVVSLVNSGKTTLASPVYANAITYATLTAATIFTYNLLKSVWYIFELYMKSINALVNAMIPTMATLCTMGGNVTTAVASSTGLAFILTVMNYIIQNGMLPLIKICYGLTVAGAVGNFNGINQITKTAKNTFTVILSGIMTVLSIFLLFKTNIAASADGAAARTIKFAGSFIPVIGSALGESIRSVMSGIELIKNSVGFVGIIIIMIITLPTLLHIVTTKICIDLSSGLAAILECEKESLLLKEISSILSFALAVTVCIAILLIFELTIFINISPALGGS